MVWIGQYCSVNKAEWLLRQGMMIGLAQTICSLRIWFMLMVWDAFGFNANPWWHRWRTTSFRTSGQFTHRFPIYEKQSWKTINNFELLFCMNSKSNLILVIFIFFIVKDRKGCNYNTDRLSSVTWIKIKKRKFDLLSTKVVVAFNCLVLQLILMVNI